MDLTSFVPPSRVQPFGDQRHRDSAIVSKLKHEEFTVESYNANICFFVNGEYVELVAGDISPEATLSVFLRLRRLTGTKVGCGAGGCGACTVTLARGKWEGLLPSTELLPNPGACSEWGSHHHSGGAWGHRQTSCTANCLCEASCHAVLLLYPRFHYVLVQQTFTKWRTGTHGATGDYL